MTNAGVSRDSVGVLLVDFEGEAGVRLATAETGPHPFATGQALARELSHGQRVGGRPLGLLLGAMSTTGFESEALREGLQ